MTAPPPNASDLVLPQELAGLARSTMQIINAMRLSRPAAVAKVEEAIHAAYKDGRAAALREAADELAKRDARIDEERTRAEAWRTRAEAWQEAYNACAERSARP